MKPVMRIDGRRQDWIRLLIHAIVLLIIFVLPELMASLATDEARPAYLSRVIYCKSLVFISVFYINYFFLVDYSIDSQGRRHPGVYLVANLGLLALALWIFYELAARMLPPEFKDAIAMLPRGKLALRGAALMLRDTVMVVLTIALAAALRMAMHWGEHDRRNREIEAMQRATELENLKNQLNPHFLFNTLNSIYALIELSPEVAKGAVHRLSQLLRYVLYQNPRWVEMAHEQEFVENYVELMRLRMGDEAVTLDVGPEVPGNALVAPMIFISLIENAIKHSDTGSGSHPVEIRFEADDNNLVCTTRNHYDTAVHTDDTTGIGVANLRRRLKLIYGDKASYRQWTDDDVYVTVLTVPMNFNNAAAYATE